MEEPIPGWVDNIYGPMGLSVSAGIGILRVLYMNEYICEDVVPVDIVIKAVLVVIWKLGLTKYDHQLTFTSLIVSNYNTKVSYLFVKFKEEYLVEYKPVADICIIIV